jgi:uncharacterized protein (DUF2147 family)
MMMTNTLKWMAALCFAALSTAPTLALAAAGASPVGQWQVVTGEARYTVTNCGGGLCAKLVWLRSDAKTDENLALLNHYVVKGARPAGTGTWNGNVTFNGHSYAGTMQLVSKNYMTLKGCAGVLCQTYQFSRI